MEETEVKKFVREGYARITKQSNSCCSSANLCCGSISSADDISRKMGYKEEELKSVPEGANLGLGCGNPVAIASLKEGETVLDLGAGAGFDCFLAANKVGKTGKVIGVDMTPEMVEKARENAREANYKNVEFSLGEIENLPVADNSVDIIISNCVINLSTDKKRVFFEAFRVLRPGGRFLISDIVLLEAIPDAVKSLIETYVGCISGAIMRDEYVGAIKAAGFQEVMVIDETPFPVEYTANDPAAQALIQDLAISPEMIREVAGSLISVRVSAVKPN